MGQLDYKGFEIPLATVGEVRGGIRFTEDSLRNMAKFGRDMNLFYKEETRQLVITMLLYGEKAD